MERKPDSPYAITYDLSNCDKEPLRFISTVQPHAALLVCAAKDLTILQASNNCDQLLGLSANQLLQQGLRGILPAEAWEDLQAALNIGKEPQINHPIRIGLPKDGTIRWFNCLVHQEGDCIQLEFEPFDDASLNASFQNRIGAAIQRIRQGAALQQVLDAAAWEVKRLMGYDRVMVYRFDRANNGHVVAEAREQHLEPFLDLHYPASDIPPQARELFLKNPVRIISDVEAEPAYLMPPLNPQTQQPSDLGQVAARGVSPIHLEYLSNMGVRASMSISIIFEGKLWGLIACHHYADGKFTGYLRRNTALMLSHMISAHVSLQAAQEFRNSALEANIIKSKLFGQMAADWDIFQGLTEGEHTMLDINGSHGAAVFHENRLVVLGEAPEEAEIRQLIGWLDKLENTPLYQTDELPKVYPPAAQFKDKAAGLLAVRLSKAPGDYLLWFKPEVIKTVNWGGNPEKAVVKTTEGARLSPRKSFEKWSQQVADTSQPWQQHEIDTAMALRADVKDFIFQKYREVKRFNKELTEAYQELETFSYSVSHDLRAPLRNIDSFARVLQEDHARQLGDDGKMIIQTIIDSAGKLSHFIEDILAYSKMSNRDMQRTPLPLRAMVEEVTEEVLEREKREGRTVHMNIQAELPEVVGDRMMIRQLLANVLSNAVKYSRHSNPPTVEVGGEQAGGLVHFYVKDNGIGFDTRHTEKIFGVFSRLVSDAEFEGTGVGMAIVKRIVEKHRGSIEVESEIGKGSTFHFRFPT